MSRLQSVSSWFQSSSQKLHDTKSEGDWWTQFIKKRLERLKRKILKKIATTEEKEGEISELSSKGEKSEKLNDDRDRNNKERIKCN